jgi:hypothetical protein
MEIYYTYQIRITISSIDIFVHDSTDFKFMISLQYEFVYWLQGCPVMRIPIHGLSLKLLFSSEGLCLIRSTLQKDDHIMVSLQQGSGYVELESPLAKMF